MIAQLHSCQSRETILARQLHEWLVDGEKKKGKKEGTRSLAAAAAFKIVLRLQKLLSKSFSGKLGTTSGEREREV